MHREPSPERRPWALIGVLAVVVVGVILVAVFGSIRDDGGADLPGADGAVTAGAAPGSTEPAGDPPGTSDAVSSPTPRTTAAPTTASADQAAGADGELPGPVRPSTTTTVTVPPRFCELNRPAPGADPASPALVDPAADGPASVAIAISERLFPCADHVLVAHPSHLFSGAVAAQLAVRMSVPLLFYLPDAASEADLSAELERLAPREVWLFQGVPDHLVPDGAEVVRAPAALSDLVAWIESEQPGARPRFAPTSGHRSLHALVMAGRSAGQILLPFFSASVRSPEQEMVGGAAGPSPPGRLWLADPGRPASGLAVAAAASLSGERMVYWDPEDAEGWNRTGRLIEEESRGVAEIWVTPGMSGSGRWFLEATLWGEELPGGGRIMFPDRRLVAFYGGVRTHLLGVLGEQDPAATLERLAPLLEEYAADGIMAVPAFEIITTLATAEAGAYGDYSGRFKIDTLLPWVDFAAEAGAYVVLDLQPGRTDFLAQAEQYEELLRRPHVGLALDPEWRLGPNQVHLKQIGSVNAAEVNAVIEWLAALVRRERLPQKLLIVHQFRLDMIGDRELLETPPELAVMIHMDGQGSLESKYVTWNTLIRDAGDRDWWWGWKNFFDEDSPMAEPRQVLDLRPVPYFVSYQ